MSRGFGLLKFSPVTEQGFHLLVYLRLETCTVRGKYPFLFPLVPDETVTNDHDTSHVIETFFVSQRDTSTCCLITSVFTLMLSIETSNLLTSLLLVVARMTSWSPSPSSWVFGPESVASDRDTSPAAHSPQVTIPYDGADYRGHPEVSLISVLFTLYGTPPRLHYCRCIARTKS